MAPLNASPNPLPRPSEQPKTPLRPVIVPPVTPPPSRSPWPWVLGLAGIGALAFWAIQTKPWVTDTTGGGPAAPSVRTANATKGKLESTIRLTGVTAAENFVSLIAPALRGTRGSGGRSGGNFGGNFGGGGGGGGTSSRTSSSGGSSSSSSTTAAATSGATASSGIGAASSGSGGVTANRGANLGRTGSTAARTTTSTASTSRSTSSSVMGTDGTGSTTGSLPGGGGGGGGGGGSEFMLVLQELVKPGSRVKKGQVVAEFDRQYMLTRLDDYRAAVVQTEASRKKSMSDLDVVKKAREQSILAAKGRLDKAKLDMKTLPVLSDIDIERTKLALEEAEARYQQLMREVRFYDVSDKAQIKISDLDLDTSRAELKRAEANADRMIVKTPIEGITVMQTLFRGSEMNQIQQGDQLYPGQSFMSIVDPSSMIVNASVNQVDVERLRIGQRAKVRFDAYPDLELTAKVYSVGGIPKTGGVRVNWVKEIPVRLKFDNLDPRVIPDLSVSLDVIVETEDNVTVAPAGAVFQDSAAETHYVWVQSANGRFERRKIEIGKRSYTHVSVRSGLKPDEVIALDPPNAKPPDAAPTT